MNTRFIKTTDNNIMIKMRKHIIINRVENIENPETGEIESVTMQTFNPTDEMLFADGWELYITPELTPEQILVNAREDKKRNIEEYDKSSDINEFYIQNIPV